MGRGRAGGSGSGGSGMEEAAGGRVLLSLPGVSLPLALPPRLRRGRLRVLRGPQDLELHWEPLEGPWEPPGEEDPPDPGFEPDWAVLSPPRAPRDSGWAGGFSVSLGELRGLRRGPPGLCSPFLVLLPRGGPCPPPLHLPRGGLQKILRVLGRRLRACPGDPRLLLLVTPEDPPEPPPEPGLVTRWLGGPLGGLGRLLGGPRGGEGPEPEPEPEAEPPFEELSCVRLGPRPSPSRGPPLAAEDWGRGLEPEVLRERIFRGGLSPELRPQGWRLLLGLDRGHPGGTPKNGGTPKIRETPKGEEGTPKFEETPKETKGTQKLEETPKLGETPKGIEGTPKIGGTPKETGGTPKTGEIPKGIEGTPKIEETPKGAWGIPKGNEETPKNGGTPKGEEGTPKLGGTPKGLEGTPKLEEIPKGFKETPKGFEGTPKFGETPKGIEGTPKIGETPKGTGRTPEGFEGTPKFEETPKGAWETPKRPWGIPETERERRDDYFRMKLQWRSLSPGQLRRNKILRGYQERLERDLARAPPSAPRSLLRDVLSTFCMFHFDLGYVGGMLDLLLPLLGVAPDEPETFWEFCGALGTVSENFGPGRAGLRRKLGELGALVRVLSPGLSPLLGRAGPRRCCRRWLRLRFQTHLGTEGTRRLWEVLWTGLPCPNFLLLVTCALLELLGDTWGHSGDSWGHSGDSWGHSGDSWGHSGDSWGQPGDSWGQPGDSWGHSGDSWGQPGDGDSEEDAAPGDTESEDSDGDTVSPWLDAGQVLSRAEGMFLQLAQATDLPPALQELLGLGGARERPQ